MHTHAHSEGQRKELCKWTLGVQLLAFLLSWQSVKLAGNLGYGACVCVRSCVCVCVAFAWALCRVSAHGVCLPVYSAG